MSSTNDSETMGASGSTGGGGAAPRDSAHSPSCAHVREQLPLFVGGDLDAGAIRDVAQHLDGCAACREASARLARACTLFFESEHRAAAEELRGAGLMPGIRAALGAAGDPRRSSGIERVPSPIGGARTHGPRGLERSESAPTLSASFEETFDADLERAPVERSVSGRHTVRWLALGVAAAALVLGVAAIYGGAPRLDAPMPDAAGSSDVVADVEESGSGLRKLGVDEHDDRLIFRPNDTLVVPAHAGQESLVSQPSWR